MSPMMIDEVNASKKSYIRDTPQYVQWGFLGQQDKRFMNRKSDGGHPFSQQPSQTYYEDPLIVGSKEHHKGTFLQYNNRAIESGTKHLGGALMYNQPQDSDSDSDYSSSSDEEEGGALMYQQPKADKYKGGDLSQLSKEELMEMIQGGGIYDDYIKPAGKFLGKVGSEVVNDIIVPIGKELVKDAVRGAVKGAVVGAGRRGRPKGSKNKSKAEIDPPVVEAIHLEHLVAPKAKKSKKVLANIEDELKRVEKEKVFEKGEIKAEPKKRKPRSKKVLANIEEELKRVEGEKEFEKGEIKAEGGKKKRTMSDKMKHRAELVKKVMKEHGLKLGAASKYVKEHGMA